MIICACFIKYLAEYSNCVKDLHGGAAKMNDDDYI